MSTAGIDYDRTCFVIMPFGKKKVGDVEVDFDFIYREVFEPAIRATPLAAPETGFLEPRRTDQDFFASSIDQDMFCYLEYSRFALADISGLNANVLYELGVRHRADPAGTAIFRQAGGAIPFDIKSIKAFEYSYEPAEEVLKSCEKVRQILTESLKYNRPDSPVRIALAAQQTLARAPAQDGGGASLHDLLTAAETAMLGGKRLDAIARYQEAIKLAPKNASARMKLGLLLKDIGRLDEALAEFRAVSALIPDYAEALREQGIVENKRYEKAYEKQGGPPQGVPTGEEALKRAVQLSPQDYDAIASLGGALKRDALRLDEAGKPDEAVAAYKLALEQYRRATKISGGDAFPLLNEIKIQGRVDGRLTLDTPRLKTFLGRAEAARRAQVEMKPPMDLPWSAFDLAEISLYRGDPAGFSSWIERGLEGCGAAWMARTFRQSLELLKRGGVSIAGLDEGIALLVDAESWLPG